MIRHLFFLNNSCQIFQTLCLPVFTGAQPVGRSLDITVRGISGAEIKNYETKGTRPFLNKPLCPAVWKDKDAPLSQGPGSHSGTEKESCSSGSHRPDQYDANESPIKSMEL
jgi:hypothetical protein